MYAALACGGALNGVRLLSPATLARATEVQPATERRLVVPFDMGWRLGYHGVLTTRGVSVTPSVISASAARERGRTAARARGRLRREQRDGDAPATSDRAHQRRGVACARARAPRRHATVAAEA
jgi:hypothetical protein